MIDFYGMSTCQGLICLEVRESRLLYIHINIFCTGWSDKIAVLKKITLQIYFKTFIEKNQFS